MIRIAYISKVAEDFGKAELGNVLRASRLRNERDGISGMLMYHGTSVLQILEGPEDMVRACYGRIRVDPRHSHIEPLDKRTVASRSFSDWSMGLAEPENVKALPGSSLHSFGEIADRLKAAAQADLSPDTIHVISTMKNFMARMNIHELVRNSSSA